MSTSLQKSLFASGVKVAGKNEKKSLTAISNEIDIPVEALKKLRVGEFYVQSGSGKTMKIKTSNLILGSRHAMNKKAWQKLRQSNICKYYAKTDYDKISTNHDEEFELDHLKNLINLNSVSFDPFINNKLTNLNAKY